MKTSNQFTYPSLGLSSFIVPGTCALLIERVQKRATKSILGCSCMWFRKQCLISLHTLSLMMTFELNKIILFIRCLKNSSANFIVLDYVLFCSSSTRFASPHKLIQQWARSNIHRNLFKVYPKALECPYPVESVTSY